MNASSGLAGMNLKGAVMKRSILAVALLAFLPSMVMAGGYDRGSRYDHHDWDHGRSNSHFNFSFGFSSGYRSGVSFYYSNGPFYRPAPLIVAPQYYYAPAPVYVAPSYVVPSYVAPPVVVVPQTYYYAPVRTYVPTYHYTYTYSYRR
jgi:hypothetical protein